MTFVFAWVGAFYLGELLLAIALWRAGADVIARWVPIALLGHVVSLAFVAGPSWVGQVAVVLVALPLCGLAIRVAQRPGASAAK